MGAHRYPAAEAPADGGRGLPYLVVEVEETLRPARGGPAAGARVQVFDPGQKFAYEMADRIAAGVVSYADVRYHTAVLAPSVRPGARLVFFLRAGAPAHFPAHSFVMAAGTAYASVAARPRVERALATPDWKRCPDGTTFGCAARSQGVAPARGETVPQYCGCIPRCPLSRHVLITQQAGGSWPDGSAKGRFSCSAQ